MGLSRIYSKDSPDETQADEKNELGPWF